MRQYRIIIGITGASGIIYGVRLLEALRACSVETHLVVSKAAQQARVQETDLSLDVLKQLADHYYAFQDIGARLASGSYKTDGMIIAPCSMRTLAEIACGNTTNLITRAADVILKERRKLVLMVRETPLHLVHLRNMLTITEMGGIIAPPMPAFYNHPKTLDDIIQHNVGRILDLFDLDVGWVKRWKTDEE